MVEYLVTGHFRFIDDLQETVRVLRSLERESFEVFTPVPCRELEDQIYEGKRRSPVRCFTLLGGVLGCLGGFLMTVWMSVDWPLRTSAKPIVSIPAFVVIAFECSVLFAGVFTLLSMFHFSRLPNYFSNVGFSPKFSGGEFGLSLRIAKEDVAGAEALLRECGAHQVESRYVR